MSNTAVIEDKDKWLSLVYAAKERQIQIVFKTYREHGIEPILIKGWAVAQVYPQPWTRYFSDFDFAVAPEDYQKGQTLIGAHPQINVDLHRGLRHLDTVDWKDLFANSRLITINDNNQSSSVRILSEEDHLRVLCVHWLQDGGAYQNRLQDIYYAVANRSPNFDWNKCLEVLSEKRKTRIIYTIGLAHYYLDLNLDDFPYRERALKVPNWMRKTVEREWRENVRLVPLANSLGNRRELWKQIKKRFPPNPIQATIDVNGSFDNGVFRIFHQLGSIIYRSFASLERVYQVLLKTLLKRL